MNEPTTTHRPTKEELLEAMQLLYGDVADWNDVCVRVPDGDGGEMVVNDPTIEFRGELNPQIADQKSGGPGEYEEARDDLQQQAENNE